MHSSQKIGDLPKHRGAGTAGSRCAALGERDTPGPARSPARRGYGHHLANALIAIAMLRRGRLCLATARTLPRHCPDDPETGPRNVRRPPITANCGRMTKGCLDVGCESARITAGCRE
ncbi:hypothetical protein GCM10010112_13920 [Actinoplanes lobatus]|uniref:Transposase n=1 Tax=Actinoplanes lobatus TaxID=113568 RepID=A0ABQ4APG4_9ACTN|nr:hypothetical protein GCM10010112_13920 [Actinoplanes lobatus]GIE42911.1 hypothetical protein Alo02nite_58090 [Actinoplanes lobatus]